MTDVTIVTEGDDNAMGGVADLGGVVTVNDGLLTTSGDGGVRDGTTYPHAFVARRPLWPLRGAPGETVGPTSGRPPDQVDNRLGAAQPLAQIRRSAEVPAFETEDEIVTFLSHIGEDWLEVDLGVSAEMGPPLSARGPWA